MVFSETDLPPIFESEATTYNIIKSNNLWPRKLNKSELKGVLEEKGLSTDRKVDQLRQQSTEANISLTETKCGVIPGKIRKLKTPNKLLAKEVSSYQLKYYQMEKVFDECEIIKALNCQSNYSR